MILTTRTAVPGTEKDTSTMSSQLENGSASMMRGLFFCFLGLRSSAQKSKNNTRRRSLNFHRNCELATHKVHQQLILGNFLKDNGR